VVALLKPLTGAGSQELESALRSELRGPLYRLRRDALEELALDDRPR
jgi:hypothetical protein